MGNIFLFSQNSTLNSSDPFHCIAAIVLIDRLECHTFCQPTMVTFKSIRLATNGNNSHAVEVVVSVLAFIHEVPPPIGGGGPVLVTSLTPSTPLALVLPLVSWGTFQVPPSFKPFQKLLQ